MMSKIHYPQSVFIVMLLACVASTSASAQSAEEAATACRDAATLIEDNDIEAALEEARWCLEGLEQLKRNQTLAVLPDAIEGHTGGEVENQSALGMNIIERKYTGEDGSINVSITTGVASGGLAALAQMGMSLGSASGKKMRIQKRTVIDMSTTGGDSSFMVQLKSGGMITMTSSDLSAEDVLVFVKAFPIAEIDDALK